MAAEIIFILPLNLTDNRLASNGSHVKIPAMALNIETITNQHGHKAILLREALRNAARAASNAPKLVKRAII